MAQSINQVNSYDNILYFLNGAYNLDTNEFQKDVQETNKLSTGINYVEELDTEKVKFINDFINKVQLRIQKSKNKTIDKILIIIRDCLSAQLWKEGKISKQ